MNAPADNRPPIDPGPDGGGPRWRTEVVEETTSTNADVAERFRAGEREGLVLVAEHQTAGRGRLGREWVSPARSSLTVSFLLVPEGVPAERWPWLPLLTGVAAAAAVRRVTGVQVDLKWPNDVLADGQKLGGILLERVDRDGTAAAVVGIGINCAQSADELPVPEATSLSLVTGAPIDRSALLAALLDELATRYDEWRSGVDLRVAYLELCVTPGQDVRVAVPGGEVTGRAVDVDAGGRLVVRTEGGEEHLGVGDVVHVRPR
jgi:BirA family biotin operon repressor/biotin-[acetyl-CoA-carboxylase] ligase